MAKDENRSRRSKQVVVGFLVVMAAFIALGMLAGDDTPAPRRQTPPPASKPAGQSFDCDELRGYVRRLESLMRDTGTLQKLHENRGELEQFAESLPAPDGPEERVLDLVYATAQGLANAAQMAEMPNATDAGVSSVIELAVEDSQKIPGELAKLGC